MGHIWQTPKEERIMPRQNDNRIPLANRMGGFRAPTAQAGRTFDPSQSIESMGRMAANSYQLAAKAVDDMGSAITLLQRQNEDIKAKQAYLKLEQSITDAQTKLSTQQGLKAEEYRNNQFRKDIEKAQLEFNNVMKGLRFSDIRNASTESGFKSIVNADASADNYAFKEKLAARNQMSKDLQESYKRQAVSVLQYLNSPNENMRNMAKDTIYEMLANTIGEVQNNANLNGLLDDEYKKLKQQEAIDNFHVSMAEELSHGRGGLYSATDYMNTVKGEMSTAAWEQEMRSLDDDKLTYEVMKDPNKFFTNGVFNEDLAENIAPHLNDRIRYRVANTAKECSKSGASFEDIQAAEAFSRKHELNFTTRMSDFGFVFKEDDKSLMSIPDNEGKKEMLQKYGNAKFSDIHKGLYYQGRVPATTKLVLDKQMGNSEVSLPTNPQEQEKTLAMMRMNPQRYTIIENVTALGNVEYTKVHFEIMKALNGAKEGYGYKRKSAEDGLGPGWVTRGRYNTFDGIGVMLEQEFGMSADDIMNIFDYMETNKRSFAVQDKDGKLSYPLANYNFYADGEYDRLYKNGQKAKMNHIGTLLTLAIQDKVATKDRASIYSDKTGSTPTTNALESFINRRYAIERGLQAAGETAQMTNPAAGMVWRTYDFFANRNKFKGGR